MAGTETHEPHESHESHESHEPARISLDERVESARKRWVSKAREPVLRAHVISDWWRCPRLFWWKHFLRVEPSYEPAMAARDVGSCFHRIVACLHRQAFELHEGEHPESFDLDAAVQAARTELSKEKSVLQQQYEAAERAGRQTLAETILSNIESSTRAQQIAEAMFRSLWQKYPPFYRPSQLISAEQEYGPIWLSELTGLEICEAEDVRIGGRPDCLLRDAKNPSVVWLVDYKTGTQSPQHLAAGRAFSFQSRIYRMLAEHKHRLAVAGIIYTILAQPTIRYCSKDNSFDDYVKRVTAWYDERGKDAASSIAIMFGPREREDMELALSIKPIVETINAFIELLTSHDRIGIVMFPRIRNCVEFQSICPYLELCESSAKSWHSIINNSGRFKATDPEPAVEEPDSSDNPLNITYTPN